MTSGPSIGKPVWALASYGKRIEDGGPFLGITLIPASNESVAEAYAQINASMLYDVYIEVVVGQPVPGTQGRLNHAPDPRWEDMK